MVSIPKAAFAICLCGLAAACLKVPDDFADEPGKSVAAPSTAAEVLTHHIDAIGGEEKLRAIKQRTVEARMLFRAEKGCEEGDENCASKDETGTFYLENTADGRLYRRTVLGELVEERGFDGTVGWQLQSGGALRLDTEKEAASSREDALLHWYFEIAKRGVETTLLSPRREDSDGNVTILDGIKWSVKDGTSKELWFDRSTGLLREERVQDGEGDQLQSQTIVYDDYRAVDDVLIAHTIRVVNVVGTREQVVEFQTQRAHHDKLGGKKFAVPTVPDPDPKPDGLLAALKTARTAAGAKPKDLAAQVEHARVAFAAAHFDEASKAARSALAVDAREPEVLFVLARVQVMAGDFRAGLKTLSRAKAAGLKPEVIARQKAWIHHRRRNYAALAKALDDGGSPVLAGRYRSFAGKPIQVKTSACEEKVPMIANDPLAVVEIDIGDKKVGAILDTGAADLIVTKKLAAELGITAQAQSQLGEGIPPIGHGQTPEVKLGGITLTNVPANIFDDAAIADMAGDEAERVGAVLGAGLLTELQLTIDAPGKAVTLVGPGSKCKKDRERRRTGSPVPMWIHETHYMYVLGKLNGAEGIYLINTGMRGADMTATQVAYAHAGIGVPTLRSDKAPMVKVKEFGLGTAYVVKGLESAFGYFETPQTTDGFRLDGMIGLGVLRQRAFTMDFETQRIYFAAG